MSSITSFCVFDILKSKDDHIKEEHNSYPISSVENVHTGAANRIETRGELEFAILTNWVYYL